MKKLVIETLLFLGNSLQMIESLFKASSEGSSEKKRKIFIITAPANTLFIKLNKLTNRELDPIFQINEQDTLIL
jgi:hypothetical protein